jgi:ribonucleoside-diphosphate reductase alpha chain
MAVGNALLDMWEEMQSELRDDGNRYKKQITLNNVEPSSNVECPECGSQLTFEGGCNICKSCGWSKCS